ncbi:MAG: PLDc_N domain-containing protein [Actinobacteria bacterium]|nr:MAG: PLDc_N domain-containing protein [Actinomycetota bacterium]
MTPTCRRGPVPEEARTSHRARRERGGSEMFVASGYPFADVLWTMLVFFAWVIWVSLVVMVLLDNFRRHDHSGLAKAGWTVFIIFVPLFGVLLYMITRSSEADAVLT